HLSPRDLASVAIGASLWIPILLIGMGVLMSVAPSVAHDYGARRYAEIGGHVRQGLWLSQIVAVMSFIALRSCAPVLRWIQVDPEIVPTATGFLNAVSWGIPASCAFTVLRGYSESVAKTRPMLAISLVGLAVNIAGNSVFMYGRLGMPRLGAVGTGVASACVIWAMLISMSLWIAFDPGYRRFPIFDQFQRPDWRQVARLLKLGGPIGACLFLETSMFATVSLMMGRMGADVAAGHQVA